MNKSTDEKLKAWFEIDEERYWYLLDVLPPAALKGNAFMVGEPWTHDERGPIHQVVVKVEGRYFTRNAALNRFDPRRYTQEICKIFGISDQLEKADKND